MNGEELRTYEQVVPQAANALPPAVEATLPWAEVPEVFVAGLLAELMATRQGSGQ